MKLGGWNTTHKLPLGATPFPQLNTAFKIGWRSRKARKRIVPGSLGWGFGIGLPLPFWMPATQAINWGLEETNNFIIVMILNKLMIMFVSESVLKQNLIAIRSCKCLSHLLLYESINSSSSGYDHPYQQSTWYIFSLAFSFAASYPENRDPFCTVQQEFY